MVSHGPPLVWRLAFPPAMTLALLYVGHNSMVATSPGGIITPGNRKLMWWGTVGFFVFMEVLFWWVQIRAFWRSDPLGFVATFLLFGWIVYCIAAKWVASRRRAQQLPNVHYDYKHVGLDLETTITPLSATPQGQSPSPRAPGRAQAKDVGLRIRQAIVLIWGVLGLAGGLIAIILHPLRKH